MTEASNRVIAAITDPWDHPRTMVSVALMCEWGASHGIEVEALLRGTRIDAGSLNDPEGLVEARQEMAVIRNLVTAIGHRPGLGVELGSLYHLTAYGYLGYLLTASATARDTVERGLHFALLTFAFTTMTARIDAGGRYVLTLEADDVPEDIRGFVLERDTAAVVQIHREIFPGAGRVPLREIRLATGDEGSTGVFADFFQVPVVFGCPSTEVVLDAGYLDEVPPMANTHTAQLLVAQCERIRAERLHHTGVAARVRAHLLDRTSLDLTLEDVAQQLHYAPRTLRRISNTRARRSVNCSTRCAAVSRRTCCWTGRCHGTRSPDGSGIRTGRVSCGPPAAGSANDTGPREARMTLRRSKRE